VPPYILKVFQWASPGCHGSAQKVPSWVIPYRSATAVSPGYTSTNTSRRLLLSPTGVGRLRRTSISRTRTSMDNGKCGVVCRAGSIEAAHRGWNRGTLTETETLCTSTPPCTSTSDCYGGAGEDVSRASRCGTGTQPKKTQHAAGAELKGAEAIS
jgi:hypothetical protein